MSFEDAGDFAGPEPYEDDLEEFERNQCALDASLERAESEIEEDGLPDEAILVDLLEREFSLLGYSAPGRAGLERMAHLMARQEIDFGEIGVTGCVLGWLAHAAMVRAL
jgi:hypothetical protein